GERLGAKVVAFVEPAAAELAPEELDNVCLRSGLARFKRPRQYVFVKTIPRSASGKLLRRKLRTGEYEAFEGNKATVQEDSGARITPNSAPQFCAISMACTTKSTRRKRPAFFGSIGRR